jgi:hypothetical protein
MVFLANPTLGFKIFKEIQCHYDSKGNEEVEMKLEKLQLLVTSIVESIQKVIWLKWWNSKCFVKENLRFLALFVKN